MREYWLPTRPLMFSHFGCAGSLGGLSGSNAMWHEPQVVPIRNGGSYEASASLLTRSSDGMPVALIICLRKPSQLARVPPFSCFHFCGIEARIRELAQAQRAGGGAELEIARRMALVERCRPSCADPGVERRVLADRRPDRHTLACRHTSAGRRRPDTSRSHRSRRDSWPDNPDRRACSRRDR